MDEAHEGSGAHGLPVLPYGRQAIDKHDVLAVVEALASDWLTTGPRASELEESFAEWVGAECSVAISSGTAALPAAVHALEIGPGDEVVVPALTFAASANCVLYQGGNPVFVDADPVCVLDGYDLGGRLREAIRSAGLSLVVIDDNADKGPYRADVVLNPNVHANARDYGVDRGTEYLCGPAYHLLRAEIRATPRRQTHPEHARRVLVNMGGTDQDDHTSAAVESLIDVGPADLSASVVVGQAYPHLGKLEALVAEAPFDVRVLHQPRLGPVYQATEMAVTAGGSTALELAYLEIPMLIRITADNQRRSATWLRDNGGARLLESLDSMGSSVLAACRDAQWRRSTSANLRALLDGRGPGRVMDALESRTASPRVGSA